MGMKKSRSKGGRHKSKYDFARLKPRRDLEKQKDRDKKKKLRKIAKDELLQKNFSEK